MAPAHISCTDRTDAANQLISMPYDDHDADIQCRF